METSKNISKNSKKILVKKEENVNNPLLTKPLKLVKKSEIVENESNFKKIDLKMFEIDFIKRYENIENNINSPNPLTIQKAYDRILVIWNTDEKSRNFLKHLIASFVPFDPYKRLFNLPKLSEKEKTIFKCAITNFNITGIKNIAEDFTKFSMKKMYIDCQCSIDKRTEYTKEEIIELEEIGKTLPLEVKNKQIGVCSDKSNKYLLVETNIALQNFVELAMLNDVDEILFLMNKVTLTRLQEKSDEKNQQNVLSTKEINKVAKANTYGIYGIKNKIDSNTLSKLENLKNSLSEKENN